VSREFGESTGRRGSFEQFYALVSTVVWQSTRKVAQSKYHAGIDCKAAPPRFGVAGAYLPAANRQVECHPCASAHVQTVHLIYLKWEREMEKGTDPDPVRFARMHAEHRWGDTVAKAEGSEFGWIQQPTRTVYRSSWIRDALGDDPRLLELLLMVLRFVQSHDPIEQGHDFPYVRFARRLVDSGVATTPQKVGDDIERLLGLLAAVRPNWVAKEIYGKSQHLARTHGLDDRWQDEDVVAVEVPAPAVDVDLVAVRGVLRAAAARGCSGAPGKEALWVELVAAYGEAVAGRVRADKGLWRAVVARVQAMIDECGEPPRAA